MEKIKIGNTEELYEIVSIQPVDTGVLQIVFANAVPQKWGGDIILYTAGDVEAATLTGYDTLLMQEGKLVQLAQSDSGFEPVDPPEAQKPLYTQLMDQMATIKEAQEVYGRAAMFAAVAFTDEQALQVQMLYPLWSDLPDGTIFTKEKEAVKGTEITRVRGDDGKLYRVVKTHQKQFDWIPGQATSSLFEVIDTEHSGTREDPIPASVNMEYFKDKYYIEDGQLYLCIRDSEITLQYLPSQLIGDYFEIVR